MMSSRRDSLVLLALLIATTIVKAVPVTEKDTKEQISTTVKPLEMKNDEKMKQIPTTTISQVKRYNAKVSNLKDNDDNKNKLSSVDSNNIASLISTRLALNENNNRQLISFLPLNNPDGGTLIIPSGGIKVIGKAYVSIKDSDDDEDDLSEEERALRRRRRIRKRNNGGSLDRRRRRKGENEIYLQDYYNNVGSGISSVNRRRTNGAYYNESNNQYRRQPQRRRTQYRPVYYYYNY